jgi:flagellar protein FlbD
MNVFSILLSAGFNMLTLTYLSGSTVYLNPDVIKTVEATPDTVITLQTGDKLLVLETAHEVRELFMDYQRLIRQQSSL